MEREQIIKALECCNDEGDCSVCPYERARFVDELECTEELHADALALIKKLTIELDAMRGAANSYKMHNERLTEENERLTKANEVYAEIEQGYIVTGVKKVQSDTLNDMQTRFAMHFGTYRPTDEVKVTEVFKLLKKISGEMLYEEEECPSCKHFVGCECFDGETCDLYEKNTEDEKK